MQIGQYFKSNQKKIAKLKDIDWRVALKKCKEHIRYRLFQKTLYGAHTSSNLGKDPFDYYLEIACDKILLGDWEWQDKFDLSEQLIRIINSYISKEVEKYTNNKEDAIKYSNLEEEFYKVPYEETDLIQENEYEARLNIIEQAVHGDVELELLWEAIKEGKKRIEIAELLEVDVRRVDKLREKLAAKVKQIKNLTK
jgi:hypothetical protein